MSGSRARRAGAFVVGVALVAQGLIAGSSAAEPSAPAGTAAAASIPVVRMICTPGQTDINRASVADLQAALDLPSVTAQRVVAGRPYLHPRDLIAIQGVGPGHLGLILGSKRACAEPIGDPPASADACVDSGPDLQSATVDELMRQLRLPKLFAGMLVAARPFPTERNIVPRRFPGLSPTTLSRVLAAACLTPAPMRGPTLSWRWAYRSVPTTIRRDAYAMTVPAGVVTGTGSWLSIEPMAPNPGPAADFAIHGAWSGQVRVTLPKMEDDSLPDGWSVPSVLHDPENPDGADAIWSGDGLSTNDATASFWTSRLSPYEYNDSDATVLFPTGRPGNWDETEPEAEAARQFQLRYTPLARGTAAKIPGCEGTGDVVADVFMLPDAFRCSVRIQGDQAIWRLTNRRTALAGIQVTGGARIVGHNEDNAHRVMTWMAEDVLKDPQAGYSPTWEFPLLPGASVDIAVTRGSAGQVLFDDMVLETTVLFALEQVTSIASALGIDVGVTRPCFFSIELGAADGVSYREALSCALDLLAGGNLTAKVKNAAKLAKKWVLAFFLARTALDAVSFDGGRIALSHLRPVSGDGLGGVNRNPAGGPDGRLPECTGLGCVGVIKDAIGRFGTGAAYIVRTETGTTAWGITDRQDYICFAQHYPVVDWLGDNLFWDREFRDPADCVSSQKRSVPSDATDFILRHGTDNQSWFLDGVGQLHEIPDGGTYICLAHRYYMLDWVPDSSIETFARSPDAATCP